LPPFGASNTQLCGGLRGNARPLLSHIGQAARNCSKFALFDEGYMIPFCHIFTI
jgi:hypothetical protein